MIVTQPNAVAFAKSDRASRRMAVRGLIIAVIGLATFASHAQALRPLPPDFVNTLMETDAAAANVAGILKRFKNEDLGIKSPSANQLDEALGRMDKSTTQVRSQLDDLRRRESLLLLLAIKGTLGGFASDLAGFNSLLQSATVRSPAALDKLNRELAELDKTVQAANAALRKFDSGAYALLERLDRQAGPEKP